MEHVEGSLRGPPGQCHNTPGTRGLPYRFPRATNRPEPAGTLPERSDLFFYGQVNSQDDFCEADHVPCALVCSGKNVCNSSTWTVPDGLGFSSVTCTGFRSSLESVRWAEYPSLCTFLRPKKTRALFFQTGATLGLLRLRKTLAPPCPVQFST